MIAYLKGEIHQRSADRLVVLVNGVGYEVHLSSLSLDLLPAQGETVSLFIHTHVREDALQLYGFPERLEKEMFLLLVSVSGVGPKLALTILSHIDHTELARAIGEQNLGRLTKIVGIGRKTAERLCLELKDKIVLHPELRRESTSATRDSEREERRVLDVISALANLGYPQAKATDAMAAVKKEFPAERFRVMSLEELLRHTLRSLA